MTPVEFRRRLVNESVEAFHHRAIDAEGRALWVPVLDPRPTLVLGSSQPEATIDAQRCAARGIEVVRRRTGGGAVLVSSADLVWFDLVIDRDDPLWTDDVAQAFEWVGHSCATALAGFGITTSMHTGRHRTTPLSPSVCFAGLGAGELTHQDRKLVGISQRRTRTHARFQVAVLRRWDAGAHADLLAVSDASRAAVAAELDRAAVGVDLDIDDLLDAVVAALPG